MEIREIIGNTTATPGPSPDLSWDNIKNKPAYITDYSSDISEVANAASVNSAAIQENSEAIQENTEALEVIEERLSALANTRAPQTTHIRYSKYEDGRDFVAEWDYGYTYIGVAVAETAPTDPAAYEWSLFASNIRETKVIDLSASGWQEDKSQTISVSSIGENSSVFCTPHPDNKDVYIESGVILHSATASSLVFKCSSLPLVDIKVNIQIVEPLLSSGNSSSVSSWNDLEDKPFYDNTSYESDTITWDGQPTDTSITEDEVTYYYISPATPKRGDLIGAVYKDSASIELTITTADFQQFSPECLAIMLQNNPIMFVIYQDNYSIGEIVFPKAGIYSAVVTDLTYPIELKKQEGNWPIYDIKKIDTKYLPDHVVAVSMNESTNIDLAQYPVRTLFILYESSKTL